MMLPHRVPVTLCSSGVLYGRVHILMGFFLLFLNTSQEEAATTRCRPDGTSGSEGPVSKLAGWELFEQHIHEGGWRDLEKEV